MPPRSPSLRRIAPVLLALLIGPAAARGALIRYDFGGVIPGLVDDAGASARFEGSLVYDDAIPFDRFPSQQMGTYTSGVYRPDQPPDGTGLEVRIDALGLKVAAAGLTGDYRYWTGPDGTGHDNMVFMVSSPGGTGPSRPGAHVAFTSDAGRAFPDWSLRPDLKLSDLTSTNVGIAVPHPNDPSRTDSYSGEIDTLTVTQVPEPAWTVVAFLGATAWFARRRRGEG